MPLHDLILLIQVSVSPVIVISGVGLVLLSMTNRYGRVIDKAWHHLDRISRAESPAHKAQVLAEVRIIYHRCRSLRIAISLACISLLLIALLIGLLFVFNLLHLEMVALLAILFVGSMLALSASLIFFLLDINTSLKVLSIEVEMYQEGLLIPDDAPAVPEKPATA